MLRTRSVAVGFMAMLSLAGCAGHVSVESLTTTSSTTSTTAGHSAESALGVLDTLAVKGRAPKTGYSRRQFGPAWADVDRNGCDTRNDVLNRDLDHRVWRDGTHGCVVVAGDLVDPYTGVHVPFVKADASAVQIDHVVALSDAWQTGAAVWDPLRRLQFANDPVNLIAVEGSVNQAKSGSDAASWLPPAKSFRCAYVARQVTVKATFGLWVTPPERDTIARILARCPSQPRADATRP